MSVSLKQVIEDYLGFIQHEQGLSRTTTKSYHAYIYKFHNYLKEKGYKDPAFSDFNNQTIRSYYYHVCSKGRRPRTLYTTMIPLRSFGAYCVGHSLLEENPAKSIVLPKKDAAIRKETSEAEIQQLLEGLGRLRNKNKTVFYHAVISVLVYTGVRRDELCNLLVTDVDLDQGWLLVRNGKGNKSRKVPLCSALHAALKAWSLLRAEDATYLFQRGSRRLYYVGLKSVVEEVKSLAGLQDRAYITPHSLRHACASRLMRQGASLHEVMTWLGHSQIATTQMYLHVSQEDLKAIGHLAEPRPVVIPTPTQPVELGTTRPSSDRYTSSRLVRRRIAR